MTDDSNSSRRGQRFIDNAGHMSPDHVQRLRQLGQSSAPAGEPGFLRGLSGSDRELADSIAEDTVANMTSGQQSPPSVAAFDDWTDLSIDASAPDSEIASSLALWLDVVEHDTEQ